MTDDITPIWRWELPDNWTPEGLWCLTVQIPADAQYVTKAMAALGLLTISKSWARDATKTGAKTVAKTWEDALYNAPPIVEHNCFVLPSPPAITPEIAADWSAGIIQLFAESVIGQLNTCAPTVGDCSGCVASLMADLSPYGASAAVQGMLARLCQDLNNLSGEARASYEADCPYIGLFDNLKTNIADNPYDWLNKLSDWLFAWLNSTSDAIVQDIASTAALLGGSQLAQYVNDHGGAGGGAGFGSSCPWEFTFDFTASDGAWFPTSGAPPVAFGEYSAGVGWIQTEELSAPNYYSGLEIAREFAETEITYIGLTGAISGSVEHPYPGGTNTIFKVPEGGTHVLTVVGDFPGGHTWEWTGDIVTTSLAVGCNLGVNDALPVGGTATYTSVTLRGIGVNPFV